jgi:DNA-directed DNA polymerase III PolC
LVTRNLTFMSFSDKFVKYDIPVLFNGVRLPEFKPSKAQYEYVGVMETVSNKEFLTELCRKGFREKVVSKIDKSLTNKYADQVKEELRVIDSLGFIDYILMVWDICDFCRRNEIPTGPGRGSVASSIICYLIGITKIDSIKNGLFFTRFLNPSRAKTSIIDGIKYIDGSLAPDIDQDLCFYRRGEVIEYLNQKYPNRTAKLLTTGSFTTKILLKEVLKCYEEASEGEANEVSELVEKRFGIVEDLGDALSDDPGKENKKLKDWAKNHPNVISISLKLRGLKKSVGCHASAVLIAHDEIVNLMPLQLTKGEETGEYAISNSCDMYTAQELTLKFDELGLKTASVIYDCCKAAGIKVDDINVEDPVIYQWLQDGADMYGIFQFESESQGKIAQQIKPKNFQQISDSLAISRPGAVSGLKKYLNYVHNGIYETIHPVIDDVLKPTGGICLFQEQYLKMLVNVGMDPNNAELARRTLGKKKVEEIPKVKKEIEQVCEKNGIEKNVVDLLLKIAEESGGYQFAAAHSSAYATITAQTIWLKIKYPVEFYWACLKMTRYDSPKDRIVNVARIKKEMDDRGIKLYPPSLLKSQDDHAIDNGAIRIGLSSVKGVAGKAIDKIHDFKAAVTNKFALFAGLQEAGISISVSNALIMAGCFDELNTGSTRNKFLAELELYKLLTPKEKPIIHNLGERYNYNLQAILKACVEELKDTKGKSLIKESRRDTIRKNYNPSWVKYLRNSKFEELTQWIAENEFVGFSYSTDLKSIYSKHIDGLSTLKEIKGAKGGKYRVVAQLVESEKRISKNKNAYVKYTIKDDTDSLICMDFSVDKGGGNPDNGVMVKEDDIAVWHLEKNTRDGGEIYFVGSIVPQEVPTVLKTSTVRKELEEKGVAK